MTTTKEEKLREEFEQYCYKDFNRLIDDQPLNIVPCNLASFWIEKRKEELEEIQKLIKMEIEIMVAEEPSNYPTPQGEEAVYGVLGRLEERITNALKDKI